MTLWSPWRAEATLPPWLSITSGPPLAIPGGGASQPSHLLSEADPRNPGSGPAHQRPQARPLAHLYPHLPDVEADFQTLLPQGPQSSQVLGSGNRGPSRDTWELGAGGWA